MASHQRKFTSFTNPAGILAGSLGILAAMIGLLGATLGPDLTYKQYQQVKQEISELSQSERARINRNRDKYEAMSASDQAAAWQMHRYVEQKQLLPLVEDYNSWLETLSPFERQQLRDSDDRISAVESIIRNRQAVQKQRMPELIGRVITHSSKGSAPLAQMLRNAGPMLYDQPELLAESELDTLFNEVLLPQIPSADRQDLAEANGTRRYVEILRASMGAMNNPQNDWPSLQTFAAAEQNGIELTTSDPTLVERAAMVPRLDPLWKRIGFRRLVLRSLLFNEMLEFEQSAQPISENDLLKFFAKLEASDQATLLDTPADYQAEALKWMYVWDRYRGESIFTKNEFAEVMLQMRPRFPDEFRRKFGTEGRGRNGPPGNGPRPNGGRPSGSRPEGRNGFERPGAPRPDPSSPAETL